MIKLEEGEQNLMVIRRHFFVMVPIVATLVLLAVAPFILYFLILSDFIGIDPSIKTLIKSFLVGWRVFAYSIWLLLLWTFFFVEWTDYYLDLWLITDRRIIDVEQKGFFNREVTSFSFNQIQDVTVETKGVIETFFRFGKLHIQTAGHNRDLIIDDAYNPEEARSLILKLQQKL